MVANSLLPATPTPQGKYIAISQVGAPTIWGGTSAAPAKPAIWATRFSTLTAGGTNYVPGDLVSFIGQTHAGQFSQQIAIIVDAVGAGGAITQWHFLWGGLYDKTVNIDNTLIQDTTAGHNYLQGSPTPGAGAILKPAWSGWSILNNQNIPANDGSLYRVGDTITLSKATTGSGTIDGSTVNQGQFPQLVVESIDSHGAVLSFDWLDYGSYSQLPASPLALSSMVTSAPSGAGFTINPVQWTQGPLVSTIDWVAPDATSGFTDIFLSENFSSTSMPVGTFLNAFPAAMTVQYFYYGDDDGGSINAALKAQNSTATAIGDGAAFVLPGACGTTQAINLPQNTTANFVNPSLIGGNFQSTGLYAFAAPLTLRGAAPVLSRVIYGGLANAAGGGVRDMFVEAIGAPEGYGYYGMAQSVAAPTGYVGPSASTSTPFPVAGDAIEIDSGPSMRIEDIHVSDGGMGSGNAVVQCGMDESDPTGVVRGAAFSNIVFNDSRLDGNSLYSGATNPDISLRLANSCHGSVFRALSVYDGTKADVLEYNGNLLSQTHLNSDAANSTISADPTIIFTALNSGFAGVADYGVYAIGNTSAAQTQCDIANRACIFVLPPTAASLAASGPGQISDTQMKCGSLQSVPPSYHGVELGAGVINTTVGGTASSGKCNVPSGQLLVLDGAINQTVSLCNNSNAPSAYCAGYQYQNGFAAGRYYTQPSLGYVSVALSGAASGPTTLYGIPFINPTGGTITQMGIQVTVAGTGTTPQCELGIYSSANGVPANLLLDSGLVSVGFATPRFNTGLNFVFAPNTLYFLAIGCNTAVSVEGTTGTNGLAGLLLGEPDLTTFGATNVTSTWSAFAAHGLPATFGTVITPRASTDVPNIHVGP